MTLSFRMQSGTYKPMAAESTPPRPSKTIRCAVRLLDDSQQMIDLDKSAVGQALLDRLFDCLDLAERDYFSLQLLDHLQDNAGVIKWIEADKKIRKQFKSEGVHAFLFRVKFYTPDPCRLHEEYTRYHYFMQLKLDIAERRMWCDEESSILLASYAVQSELGDYNTSEHHDGYLSEFRYFSNISVKPPLNFDKRVEELHKQHRGQSPADAEFNFLYHVRNLETYGVALFEVVSFPPSEYEEPTKRPYNPDDPVHVGVSASGLSIFRLGQRSLTYPWCNICKVSFKQRQFLLSIVHEAANESFTNSHGKRFDASFEGNGMISADGTRDVVQHAAYTLCNAKIARSLWQTAVEYHTFFRLKSPPNVTKSATILAPFNVAFRYSGRTEFQGIEDMKRKMRTIERPFSRASFNRYARRTVSSTMPVGAHHGNRLVGSNSHQSSMGRLQVSSANGTHGKIASSASDSNSSSWLGRSSFGFGIVSMAPFKTNNSNGTVSHARTISMPANGVANTASESNGSLESGQNGSIPRKPMAPLSSQHLLGIPEKIEDLPYYEEVGS